MGDRSDDLKASEPLGRVCELRHRIGVSAPGACLRSGEGPRRGFPCKGDESQPPRGEYFSLDRQRGFSRLRLLQEEAGEISSEKLLSHSKLALLQGVANPNVCGLRVEDRPTMPVVRRLFLEHVLMPLERQSHGRLSERAAALPGNRVFRLHAEDSGKACPGIGRNPVGKVVPMCLFPKLPPAEVVRHPGSGFVPGDRCKSKGFPVGVDSLKNRLFHAILRRAVRRISFEERKFWRDESQGGLGSFRAAAAGEKKWHSQRQQGSC